MEKWLTIHPKVKAAFVGVALVAIANASAATNGAETWNQAGLLTLGAVFTAALAYLKSA